MTEKGKKYLADILMAIHLIENFVSDTPDFKQYTTDFKTKSAIERQLVIVGEALNKLKNHESNLIIQNDAQIIAFRNRLVHAYDGIDDSIVWVIVQKYLPELKNEILNL